RNGVIELEDGLSLPDGTEVLVSSVVSHATKSGREIHRVTLPLVPSKRPGSVELTAERIAELLDEADVSA
ncbi:MAG: hypothetical protein HON53_01790, partial [Planctomycetaceae bacterium]|nr:hypothetical protein [Planctomycetaceae bacterium]